MKRFILTSVLLVALNLSLVGVLHVHAAWIILTVDVIVSLVIQAICEIKSEWHQCRLREDYESRPEPWDFASQDDFQKAMFLYFTGRPASAWLHLKQPEATEPRKIG